MKTVHSVIPAHAGIYINYFQHLFIVRLGRTASVPDCDCRGAPVCAPKNTRHELNRLGGHIGPPLHNEYETF